jgi:hypothetical protein
VKSSDHKSCAPDNQFVGCEIHVGVCKVYSTTGQVEVLWLNRNSEHETDNSLIISISRTSDFLTDPHTCVAGAPSPRISPIAERLFWRFVAGGEASWAPSRWARHLCTIIDRGPTAFGRVRLGLWELAGAF